VNYREAYGLHASNGILFNHESPRRGETFVTRKITRAVGRILTGDQETLVMGNIDSKRDWGYAPEFTEGMRLMLQQDEPGDYVLATNETTTVRDFIRMSFKHAGIELEFEGEGVDEKGIDRASGKIRVEISPRYFRPTEVDLLLGDYAKAKRAFGWEPNTRVDELSRIMVEADVALAEREKAISSL
jgi:GDPmannose 4,6-dehydratase